MPGHIACTFCTTLRGNDVLFLYHCVLSRTRILEQHDTAMNDIIIIHPSGAPEFPRWF